MVKKVNVIMAEYDCKGSLILSSRLIQYLKNNEHRLVEDMNDADYVIINTCFFDQYHEDFSCTLIKKALSCGGVIVLVVGCLTSSNNGAFEKNSRVKFISDMSGLDNYFFNKNKWGQEDQTYTGSIFDDLKERKRFKTHHFFFVLKIISKISRKISWFNIDLLHFHQVMDEIKKKEKLFVQIARGCANNCNYCIIKKSKGQIVSRPMAEIFDDVKKNWDEKKYSAVNFVADDCGSYGKDIESDLNELVAQFYNRFPHIKIDLCYINPCYIEERYDDFLRLFVNGQINSVNISIQSGSDDVIKVMGRNYSYEKVKSAIKKVNSDSPRTMIWAHYLVGHPGEKWRHFFETIRSSSLFHFICVLGFSPRQGTISAGLPNKNRNFVIWLRHLILILSHLFFSLRRIRITRS